MFQEIYALHAKHDLDEIYALLDIWYGTRDQWRAQELPLYMTPAGILCTSTGLKLLHLHRRRAHKLTA